MELQTIYNDLVDIMKSEMDFTKALKLKDKLEKAIRESVCYKTTSKTRVNAIKRIASKMNNYPALKGYGIFGDYKGVTDSYHAVMIKEEHIPLQLATTDTELAKKVGKENCINFNYPNLEKLMEINKEDYDIISIDFNDMEQFYKLHKKTAKDDLYNIGHQTFNITFIKNVIDVLGTDVTIYQPKSDIRPLYIENKNNEKGIILPIKKY